MLPNGLDIYQFDRESKELKIMIDHAHDANIYAVDFNSNQTRQLISCSQDGTIKIWDLNNPLIPLKVLNDLSSAPLMCRFNPIYD